MASYARTLCYGEQQNGIANIAIASSLKSGSSIVKSALQENSKKFKSSIIWPKCPLDVLARVKSH